MLLEDFTMDHPDLQPWDPRIKKIDMLPDPMAMTFTFVVYLHCQRKIGWAMNEEFAANVPVASVRDLIQDAVQPLIDEEYKKLQEKAGGAVDIFGKPINKFKLSVAWHVDQTIDAVSIMDEFEVIQMSDEEQYQTWCKQAANLVGSLENIKTWTPVGYTTESFIMKPKADTATIVQRNLKKLFPGLVELVTCPVCKNKNATIDSQQMQLDRAIIHLNDTHMWSREAVADWLESLDVDIAMKEENV